MSTSTTSELMYERLTRNSKAYKEGTDDYRARAEAHLVKIAAGRNEVVAELKKDGKEYPTLVKLAETRQQIKTLQGKADDLYKKQRGIKTAGELAREQELAQEQEQAKMQAQQQQQQAVAAAAGANVRPGKIASEGKAADSSRAQTAAGTSGSSSSSNNRSFGAPSRVVYADAANARGREQGTGTSNSRGRQTVAQQIQTQQP